ncbi:nucleoside deaminase [Streptomyces sp. ST2-7A]|uniref:nucleoside deaminase n=1 Tax=Streptomyces sp. ST2-7A TaxID=2907214 RepID=UPI001F438A6F|nr:nucleoside deaminase [Streptomyces sp. ST2-7A]MCE7080479.1 nucleoside deaminase [Streptomyces sp. ST2-7A]
MSDTNHPPVHGTDPRSAHGDPLRDPWAPAVRLALVEASAAPVRGDVPVGAVVLGPGGPRGPILATAHNEREAHGDPTAHAEVLALRRAADHLDGWRLTGCTLVVTLEPCAMCAAAAALSRVERVVYGAADPKAGAVGSVWDLLRDRRVNHRPEVISGVLAEECGEPLSRFFRTGRPPSGSGERPGARRDTEPGEGPGGGAATDHGNPGGI